MKKGYIQVYTGDGKGKTTAALGLSLRAAGAGLKVYFAQFLKKWDYCELKALERYADLITIEQFGADEHIIGAPKTQDFEAAQRGLSAVRAAMDSGDYDVVVMDEAGVAERFGVISTEEILNIIREKPESMELILTGRWVSQEVLAAADLVTEMKMIRHYYNEPLCVRARKGIEN